MSVEVQVDPESLQKIINKLGPELYEQAVKKMMNIAAHEGRHSMMNSVRGGTQLAVKTIHEKATPMSAEVYSIMQTPTGMKIEEGRKPGDAPSLIQVARWKTGRGNLTSRRLSEFSRGEIEEFKNIQAAIRAKGSKAKRYLQNTKEKFTQNLPSYLSDVVREIQEKWRR